MGSTAQILRPEKTAMTEEERVAEFLEIIAPLGFETSVKEYDMSVYMHPKDDLEKAVNVWVDQEDYPIFTINGKDYYCEVFYDFIWNDERHGPESMNSDMILAITAEYMKRYPDALFWFEWSSDDNMFLDKSDIDTIASQPFDPDWFGSYKSHLVSARVNGSFNDWTLK
ncbi:MAG: hypothetical protein K6G68_07725 [Oscillospiraceae bacterium]|nr:hypothetical protein [Oscillospiraceae bacterium]